MTKFFIAFFISCISLVGNDCSKIFNKYTENWRKQIKVHDYFENHNGPAEIKIYQDFENRKNESYLIAITTTDNKTHFVHVLNDKKFDIDQKLIRFSRFKANFRQTDFHYICAMTVSCVIVD